MTEHFQIKPQSRNGNQHELQLQSTFTNENITSNLDPFKVFVRIRPMNEKERNIVASNLNKNKLSYNEELISTTESSIMIKDSFYISSLKNERTFNFDKVYSYEYGNLEVFTTGIKSMLDNVLNGYNSTTLAYGMTGAGKTYTIFGNMVGNENSNKDDSDRNEKGICFYAVDYLFQKVKESKEIKEAKIKISYLEIYNETVIDLLSSNTSQIPKSLMIIEDINKGVVVPDLVEYSVNSTNEMMKLINEGNKRRTMAATNQNQFSSRSHAIIQITLDQKRRMKLENMKQEVLSSKFLVVDLAGSERINENNSKRLQESSNINKSLLSLGNCINTLSDLSKKGCFIPYRDSKLTRLLKDSLGGNIMTVMIACISPSNICIDETISTLKYASRARRIKKKISKNVKEVEGHQTEYKDIIDSLRMEVEELKEIIKMQSIKMRSSIISEPKESNQDDLQRGVEEKEIFTEMKIDKAIQIEILEEKVDMLNNKKEEIEQEIRNSHMTISRKSDDHVKQEQINRRYENIKRVFEEYLEIINEKLIENIEQNTILKFNLKEIIDLNDLNTINLQRLSTQKREVLMKYISKEQKEELLIFIIDEENNIKLNINENNNIKSELVISLNKNIKQKKALRDLLRKIISNSVINLPEDDKENGNSQMDYMKIIDSQTLIGRNKNHEKHDNSVCSNDDIEFTIESLSIKTKEEVIGDMMKLQKKMILYKNYVMTLMEERDLLLKVNQNLQNEKEEKRFSKKLSENKGKNGLKEEEDESDEKNVIGLNKRVSLSEKVFGKWNNHEELKKNMNMNMNNEEYIEKTKNTESIKNIKNIISEVNMNVNLNLEKIKRIDKYQSIPLFKKKIKSKFNKSNQSQMKNDENEEKKEQNQDISLSRNRKKDSTTINLSNLSEVSINNDVSFKSESDLYNMINIQNRSNSNNKDNKNFVKKDKIQKNIVSNIYRFSRNFNIIHNQIKSKYRSTSIEDKKIKISSRNKEFQYKDLNIYKGKSTSLFKNYAHIQSKSKSKERKSIKNLRIISDENEDCRLNLMKGNKDWKDGKNLKGGKDSLRVDSYKVAYLNKKMKEMKEMKIGKCGSQ